MSEPFVGEIRMFGGNYAPRGWALCDGQLLAVAQNDALFSLLGTIYGGDGRTTFALPDLRGRLPVHFGQGPGLSNRPIGSKAGMENVTLTAATMPAHEHAVMGTSNTGSSNNPTGKVLATAPVNAYGNNAPDPTNARFATNAVGNSGGGNAHGNIMPCLAVNFIIALFGIYPPRS